MGISGSPSKFSSLDWADFKDEFGLIAGGKHFTSLLLPFPFLPI